MIVEAGRLVRFGIVGALAGIVYAVITYLIVAAGISEPIAATIVGHLAAGFVSYLGHLHYSFGVEPDHRVFLWRFAVIAALAFTANIGTTWLFTGVLKLSYVYSILVVMVLIPIVSYLCNRFWIFKSGLTLRARGAPHEPLKHDR